MIETRKGDVVVDTDDHIKPDTTLEALAKLRAAFGKDGTVTAGNASGHRRRRRGARADDGRARQGRRARRAGRAIARLGVRSASIRPRWASARCRRSAAASSAPASTLDDVDLHRDQRGLLGPVPGLREGARARPRQGATSTAARSRLGHPLGATGTRLVLTLMYELRRSGKRYGVASACIGGGQGIAMLIENPKRLSGAASEPTADPHPPDGSRVVRSTPGKRVLFLTKDLELIRAQLRGELDLRMDDVDPRATCSTTSTPTR